MAGLLVALAGVTASPTFAHTIGRLQHFLGRVDAAEESFRLALELHEELRSPLYPGGMGRAPGRTGRGDDHSRARAMAQSALQTASGRCYGNVERDAIAVLERLP